MTHRILYFCFVACLLISCNKNSTENEKTYIGGKIVNPNTNYLVLYKNDVVIDTLNLNKANEFSTELDSLQEGIYTFKHSPESQVMYLSPGDSILIWLNTYDFDKSLNFSGRGAEKSSFLLDMFLLNQKNNDLILSYYKNSPEKFAHITDSIKKERKQKLETLQKKFDFNDDFSNIAKASINFEYYDLRERYTFLIEKYNKKFAKQIPKDFNDYRKKIDFNDKALQSYYLYTNFLDDFLRSKSIEYCSELPVNKRKDCYNLNSFQNIQRRILLIDSLSKTNSVKNEFIDRLASKSIIMADNEARIDSVLQLLHKINYSKIEEITNLAVIQRSYFKGNSIAKKGLLTTDLSETDYGNVVKKPTILATWSIYNPTHARWQHEIFEELRKKYSDIQFISVNIDVGDRKDWITMVNEKKYNKEFEFQLYNRKPSKQMFRKYLYKILFLNTDAQVIKGDVQLSKSPAFEEEILQFLNRK